ncbi:MAG: hypothetical protein DRQ49_16340 [Gammaproteobacteria bacterium]|nr:MAG: hypothetical protein DRQ49_16340 [Gammaproteobacteria bacterium]RKZ40737.1 MAG: hypothetical protein DRQ41_09040 [Gammaproteobacteria bacterium]RKZ72368.1 MAG: hypothetical protein DRQ57_17480 [Gammaproteobacteria bacterium]
MLIRLFIILAVFLVSACNENGSEQSESVFSSEVQGETSTPVEVQEVSLLTDIQGQTTASLKGTDDNANGIRDDIDQLIAKKFSYTQEIKRAAEQEARALQQFMEVKTKEEALKAAEQIARATSCTFKRLSASIRDYEKRQALSKEIEVWTTNTKERLLKYLESSKLIGGASFMQPVEPVCDCINCEFGVVAASAQQNDCEQAKFRVVFSNGELTSPKQAFTALNELALSLGNSHADQGITYDLAYNYSDEAFKQLSQSSDQRLWYVDLARQVYNWKYKVNTPELNEHVQKYREAILHGQKVLVVSHSQGNFYTNLAQQMLANLKPTIFMEGFGIFGVATPATHVGGKGTYLTNHLDIITSVPSSLPANWTLRRADSGKIVDHIGSIPAHHFSDTYLSPYYDIRPEVIKGIKQELSKLKKPPQVTKSGSMTVTLNWDTGNSNDIDLHVFEPDKTHVYFSSKTGNSGYLDVDNRQGFGPEHYYTDCQKLQVGEYLVRVQYFSDSSTPARQVTTTVTISIPGSTRTFISKLDKSNQSSSFVNLAKVVIGRTGGRLNYQIIPMVAASE